MIIVLTSRVARAAGVVLAVGAATLGAFVAPAVAAKSCEQQVIDDWYDNGRVDKQVYEAKCYRDAIRSLPTDVLDYSTAKNDILRALAFAQRGETDPGKGTTTPPTATEPTPPPPPTTTPEPTTSTPDEPPTPTDTGQTPVAAPAGESASSLPVPLIVLGGLAVLLLSAGVAGYLTRRFRGGEPPVAP